MLLALPSRADEQIGAFRIVSDQSVIALTGVIGRNSPLDLRRAAQKRPEAQTLILTSPGGLPGEALLVALEVRERGLNTFVPKGEACRSECAYVFLAGIERNADGEVAISRFDPDASEGMQIGEAELVDALNEFGTPQSLIDLIVSGDGSHTLDEAELKLLDPGRVAVVDVAPDRPLPRQSIPGAPHPTPKGDLTPGGPELEEEELDEPVFQPLAPQSKLSVAIYEGLDFFGGDLSSGHAANIAECARGCLGDNMCQAFTFNADDKIKSGPNCFLKSGTGRLEAYRFAISGQVLRNGEEAPQEFRFGAIDPTQDVVQGVRFDGNDLAANLFGINSLGECRQACIDENQCGAFTYRTATRICTLKSEAGTSRQSKGYVSGTKRIIRIPLTGVIPIGE